MDKYAVKDTDTLDAITFLLGMESKHLPNGLLTQYNFVGSFGLILTAIS